MFKADAYKYLLDETKENFSHLLIPYHNLPFWLLYSVFRHYYLLLSSSSNITVMITNWLLSLCVHSLFSHSKNLTSSFIFFPLVYYQHMGKKMYKMIAHRIALKMVSYRINCFFNKIQKALSMKNVQYSSDILLTKLKYSWLSYICLQRSTWILLSLEQFLSEIAQILVLVQSASRKQNKKFRFLQ